MVFGTENLLGIVFLSLFLLMILAFFISLFVGTARSRRRRRQADQAAQSVDFQIPAPGKSNNRRNERRTRALLFLGLGLWAAVLSARGEPVLGPIAAVVLLEFSLVVFVPH